MCSYKNYPGLNDTTNKNPAVYVLDCVVLSQKKDLDVTGLLVTVKFIPCMALLYIPIHSCWLMAYWLHFSDLFWH